MSANSNYGGGNLVDLYRVNAGHTGIIPAAGGTVIASPTGSDRAMRFGGPTNGGTNFIIGTQWAQGEGNATLPINTVKNDQALYTFLETAAPFTAAAAATELEELISEDGAFRIGGAGATAGNPEYLALHYSGSTAAGNRTVYAAIVTVSISGFPNHANGTGRQFQITLTAKPAVAAFTIANALLATATPGLVVAPGTPIQIPLGFYLKMFELQAAA